MHSLTKFNTLSWLKGKKKKKTTTSPESRQRRKLPQDNKGHIQQTHRKHPQW